MIGSKVVIMGGHPWGGHVGKIEGTCSHLGELCWVVDLKDISLKCVCREDQIKLIEEEKDGISKE